MNTSNVSSSCNEPMTLYVIPDSHYQSVSSFTEFLILLVIVDIVRQSQHFDRSLFIICDRGCLTLNDTSFS